MSADDKRARFLEANRLRSLEPRHLGDGQVVEASTVGEAAFACPICNVGSILVRLEEPGHVQVLRATGVSCTNSRCTKTIAVELRRSEA